MNGRGTELVIMRLQKMIKLACIVFDPIKKFSQKVLLNISFLYLCFSRSMCHIFNKYSINSEDFVKTLSYVKSETSNNGSYASFLSQRAVMCFFIIIVINSLFCVYI